MNVLSNETGLSVPHSPPDSLDHYRQRNLHCEKLLEAATDYTYTVQCKMEEILPGASASFPLTMSKKRKEPRETTWLRE